MSKRSVLRLNRETVRELNGSDLRRAAGGTLSLVSDVLGTCFTDPPITVIITEAVLHIVESQAHLCSVATC